MLTKGLWGSVVAAMAVLSVWATAASAAVITYTITGEASGDAQVNTGSGVLTVPFGEQPFTIKVYGLSEFSGPVPSDPAEHYVYFTSATLAGANFGGPFPLYVDVPAVPLFVAGPLPRPVPGIGFGTFGYDRPSFSATDGFTGPGLDTYNGVSDLGPIPVNFYKLPTLQVVNGPLIDFTSVSNTWFSVAGVGPGVPEPATWAMLLLGLGLVGGGVRGRRSAAMAA